MGLERNPDLSVEQMLERIAINHIVDRDDATAIGITEDELDGRVEKGLLHGDGNGSYRLLGSKRSGATAARSALVATDGLAIASWSVLHQFGTTRGAAPSQVHVLVDWERRLKETSWYKPLRTRRLDRDEIVFVDGNPHTTVARAIRELAAGLPPEPWVAGRLIELTEESLMQRTMRLEELAVQRDREKSNRVRARLQALLDHQNGDDLSDFKSRAELWLRDLIRRRGLPEPLWNVKPVGFAKELDAYFVDEEVAVEFDGFTYHHTRTKHDQDRAADRRHLRRNVRTIRVTKTDFRERRAELESDLVFIVTGIDDGYANAA